MARSNALTGLPSRYRLDGPGAREDAAARFTAELATSPRAPLESDDVDALAGLGLAELVGGYA